MWFFLLGCLLGAFLWWVSPVVDGLRTQPVLPKVSAPTREDRLSLEAKLAGLASATGRFSLELTPAECQSWLRTWRPQPAAGMALERFSFLPGKGKGTIIAEGSGLGMAQLSIIFTVSSGKPTVAGPDHPRLIQVNSYQPQNGYGASLWNRLLNTYFQRLSPFTSQPWEPFVSTMSFHEDRLILEGSIPGPTP
jgi:hypothetical protein